ncbi:MAG TPA: HAMP domain-containing protein, partial [Acidobacteriota bacterium]|nr:HAMP domain-containing protein [Acidobacteriota bacterium]
MRIRRKIAYGYIILILLLLLVQLYQLALAQKMLMVNQQFSLVDFEVSKKSIAWNQVLDGLKEFLDKFLLTGDQRYGLEVVQRMQDLDGHIESLAQFDLEPGMKEELRLLRQRWTDLSEVIGKILEASPDNPEISNPVMLLPEFEHEFKIVKLRTGRIFEGTEKAIKDNLNSQEALVQQARRFSLAVLAIGLGGSLILSFLVVRSVSKPLLQLTRGTRRLAKGDFTVLVDDSGKDELAELAAHFNVMVSRLGELDQLKGDFVSHVSHELKAPL